MKSFNALIFCVRYLRANKNSPSLALSSLSLCLSFSAKMCFVSPHSAAYRYYFISLPRKFSSRALMKNAINWPRGTRQLRASGTRHATEAMCIVHAEQLLLHYSPANRLQRSFDDTSATRRPNNFLLIDHCYVSVVLILDTTQLQIVK
jgi:hypothetical protein